MITVRLESLYGSRTFLGVRHNTICERKGPQPIFLMEPVTTSSSFELPGPSSIQSTGKPMGRLRDKNVSHLSLDGEVVIRPEPRMASFGGDWLPIPWGTTGGLSIPFGRASWPANYMGSPATGSLANHLLYISWTYDSYRDLTYLCYQESQIDFKLTVFGSVVQENSGVNFVRAYVYRRSDEWLYSHQMDVSEQLGFSSDDDSESLAVLVREAPASVTNFGGQALQDRGEWVQTGSLDQDEAAQLVDLYVQGLYRRGLRQAYSTPEGFDLGELSQECADQLKVVDENLLLLVFDVAEGKKLIQELTSGKLPEIVNGLSKRADEWMSAGKRTPRQMRRFLKKQATDGIQTLSSAYLYEKYVLENNVRTIGTMIKGLQKIAQGDPKNKLEQRLHSRRAYSLPAGEFTCTYTATMTVIVGRFPEHVGGMLAKLIARMKALGIYPELSNLHDMLMYSFVLDWFVRFGTFFSEIQAYQNVKDYFPISYAILSEKWVLPFGRETRTLRSEDNTVFGSATFDLRFRRYIRWITTELPLPPVSPPEVVGNSERGNHLAEAQALTVQRYAPRASRR